jgi:MFS family permease
VPRFWGTLSWVLMVLAVASLLGQAGSRAGEIATLHRTFYAAALTALVQAAYALSLPPSLPRRERKESGALRMRELLRSGPFLAALVVALLYGGLAQLNLMLQGLYFADESGLALSPADAGRATTVSQVLELLLFPVLGVLIDRFGLRRIVLFGIGAWVLRYAAYYAGAPTWFVIAAQVLHGPNFVLGFVGLQLAVELMAPIALRGRAQAAFATASSGIGSLVGQLGCAALLAFGARPSGGVDWRFVFALPLVVSVIATVITVVWVRNPERFGTQAGTT